MTIDELLDDYRLLDISERERGEKFERLMKNFLLTYPAYRGKFSNVWLWNEFPFREELGGKDLGIDIVAKTVYGEYWAAQCKFYAETTIIDKPAVDTFLATGGKTFDGNKKIPKTNIHIPLSGRKIFITYSGMIVCGCDLDKI